MQYPREKYEKLNRTRQLPISNNKNLLNWAVGSYISLTFTEGNVPELVLPYKSLG
jgi:hypothetical protein